MLEDYVDPADKHSNVDPVWVSFSGPETQADGVAALNTIFVNVMNKAREVELKSEFAGSVTLTSVNEGEIDFDKLWLFAHLAARRTEMFQDSSGRLYIGKEFFYTGGLYGL